MHHPAHFRGSQCERGLLDYFQSNSEGQWPITAHTVFQCFSLDQFHGIETFAVLLAVISDPSNVWMMNVCSRARFAQRPGSRAGILRHASIDDFERNSRVQHCVASAVSYGHRSRTQFDRKTIRTDLRFEVGISQWSGRQSAARRGSFGLFAVCEKTEANETAQALPGWTTLRQRSSTSPARPRCSRLRVYRSGTTAVVVHIQNSIHAISIW